MSNRNKNYANKLLRKDQHTHNLKKFQSLQWQWKASAVYGNGKVQVWWINDETDENEDDELPSK